MLNYEQAKWIAPLVQQEQKRQIDIREFRTAGDEFLKTLVEALNEAISYFGKTCPNRVRIDEDRANQGVTIVSTVAEPNPTATFRLVPETSGWKCDYQNVKCNQPQHGKLLVSSDHGMHQSGIDRHETAATLSETILKPVLFPAI